MPVYADRSADDANQGDIFEDVPFGVYPRPDGDPSLGIIISHDCDCDKFLKPNTPIPEDQRPLWPITMAPVHPIDELTGSRMKAVREGKMPRYFHLPEEDGLPELPGVLVALTVNNLVLRAYGPHRVALAIDGERAQVPFAVLPPEAST